MFLFGKRSSELDDDEPPSAPSTSALDVTVLAYGGASLFGWLLFILLTGHWFPYWNGLGTSTTGIVGIVFWLLFDIFFLFCVFTSLWRRLSRKDWLATPRERQNLLILLALIPLVPVLALMFREDHAHARARGFAERVRRSFIMTPEVRTWLVGEIRLSPEQPIDYKYWQPAAQKEFSKIFDTAKNLDLRVSRDGTARIATVIGSDQPWGLAFHPQPIPAPKTPAPLPPSSKTELVVPVNDELYVFQKLGN